MKKAIIPVIAVLMAAGFTAFTNAKEKVVNYYYLDGATWKTVPAGIVICPSGSRTQCELEIDSEDQLIYTQPNPAFPYIRN